jgi:DNA-binding transcriptional LysR family regulator
MDNWDEVRTAYHVARAGTVSGAAEMLGVHHATVIRHIDALESRLGAKLFQRHARGYTATEAGRDLLVVAEATEDQFAQLQARIQGQGDAITGELVVTSVHNISDTMTPIFARFRDAHPGVTLRYMTDTRVFRLEYGEAHVAIRAGAAPQEPDNVVQPYGHLTAGFYASPDYVDRFGLPDGPGDYGQHRFVGLDSRTTRVPVARWLWDNIPETAVVYRATNLSSLADAVVSGVGIGPTGVGEARRLGLVEAIAPKQEWQSPLWLVTHVDLHRTPKVQAFLRHLKDEAPTWT